MRAVVEGVSMSLIDGLVLLGLAVVVVWRLVWPRRAAVWRGRALVAVLALAGLQLAIEGLAWQFIPADLCLLWLGVVSLPSWRTPPPRAFRMLAAAAVVLLALAAFAVWSFPRAPRLTAPDGPYPVGSVVFRWVDPSRPESATPDPTDRRNVVAQAWYPAARDARGRRPVYIDGLGRLPARVSMLPGFMLSTYGAIDTHARLGVPVSPERPRWPVVLFSPGYGAPRAVYTSLVTALASRGYVVIVLDHPYEAGVTQLADGRVAVAVNRVPAGETEGLRYMAGQQDVRVADLRFVIDQLEQGAVVGSPLAGRLDLHVAAIGHSFGGATAVAAMAVDRRIVAAANVDGTVYGPAINAVLDRPMLLLESDHAETGHDDRYLAGNAALLAHDRAAAWRYEIKRANHYSFTDAPLFLAPPARAVLALAIGGERGASSTHRAAIDILEAFLQGPLGGAPASVAAAAARHPDVIGGPATRG
jgi:dienelactone hydrolase